MSVQSPTPAPPGWGSDALTSFLDLVRHQQFATYVNLRPQFDKILEVDNAFVALSTNVVDPEDLVGPFFSLQAHAAYRASVSLAMSTQSSPAFTVMRHCLEQSLYGLYVNRYPDSFETWIKRTVDETSRQKMKKDNNNAWRGRQPRRSRIV